MNFIDIIILILAIYMIVKGLKNGLIIELSSLIALFLGIMAGVYFSHYLSAILINKAGLNPQITYALAFVLIFIAVIIIVRIIAKIIEKIITFAAMGLVNKLLGAVFGFLKAVLIVTVLFYFLGNLDKNEKIITRKHKENSMFYKYTQVIAIIIFPVVSSFSDEKKETE